jgi:bidirectional [NiFe] hydrogenase diaphorase subunit
MTAPLRWRCCDATACRAAGAAALRQRLEAEVGADRVKAVGCLRLCGQGPLAAADHADGHTELVGGVAGERRLDPAHPFFALQRPVVLERCGLVDPDCLDDALAQGAYATLERCRQLPPQAVIEEVVRSGLRGRAPRKKRRQGAFFLMQQNVGQRDIGRPVGWIQPMK